ncbi:MAG TPA: hypothetical protein VHX59_26395 [Mycobacteriales bacterium]|nr:hypothetical protein [Mycobacteriales bacterium]
MTTEPAVIDEPAHRSGLAIPAGGIRATQVGGNTVGGVIRERAARADGYRHLDTPAMIAKLKRLHANTYLYGVWDTPVDWDDLCEEFAPAATEAGIDIWIYLVPPTETSETGRASRPYMMDYHAWAKACAELSVAHSSVKAWGIDDFEFNQDLFTADYVGQMRTIGRDINPKLGFYLCTYFSAATNEEFMDKYAPHLDAVLFPFLDGHNLNTQVASSVGPDLDAIKEHTDRRGLDLVLLVYTGRFLDAALEPTEDYAAQAVRTGLEYARAGKIAGVTAYGLQIDDAPSVVNSNRAMYGTGRLSLAVTAPRTETGAWAEASQVIHPDPAAARYELSFWHFDTFNAKHGEVGRHVKQVLVDDEVVWSEDCMHHGFALWQQGSTIQGPVDLTPQLRGKSSAKLAFRLYEQTGGANFPIDVGFDNIETIGFDVREPGFEDPVPWTLSNSGHGLPLAAVDIWIHNRPQRIFEAVAAEYEAAEQSARG